MPSPLELFIMIIFGAVGTGYFIFGKKQKRFFMMLIGIALMAYPYFVPGFTVQLILGIVLTAIPFVIQV